LKLNILKCIIKVIDTIYKKIVKLHFEQKDSFKDLAIIVDEKLSFREHLNEKNKCSICHAWYN